MAQLRALLNKHPSTTHAASAALLQLLSAGTQHAGVPSASHVAPPAPAPAKPKAVTNPYMFFCRDRSARFKNMKIPRGAWASDTAAEWSNMGDDAKKAFVEASERDKERYQKEMAAFNMQAQRR